MTGEVPYFELKFELEVIFAILGGRPPSISTLATELQRRLWNTCTQCWIENPRRRPTMQTMVQDLVTMANDLLSEHKIQGVDWEVAFNHRVMRRLDVKSLRSFQKDG